MDVTVLIVSSVCSILTAILSSSVVGTVIEHKLKKREILNEHDKNQDEGIRLILLHEFKRQGKELVKAGVMTNTDWNEFNDSYKCYKKLGGDGYADMIYAEVKKLPKRELL